MKKKKGGNKLTTNTASVAALKAPSFWKDIQMVWPVFAIMLITVICFFPTFSNEFVNLDDYVNLLKNKDLDAFDWEHVKGIFTHTILGGYNPLPIFTFAIEKSIWGLTPKVFHTNSLILHLISVFFVYRIGLSLNLGRTSSIILALLFGIHPMRVESVAWATERKDVLFGAFYFAAMFTYIRSILVPKRKTVYLILTLVLFILSLFSKIQAVALPLSLIAVDYYLTGRFSVKQVLDKIPFFILSLIIGSIGIFFLSKENYLNMGQLDFVSKLLIGTYTYCVYLGKFIFPWDMSCLYPYPAKLEWGHYISPLGVGAMVAWFVYALRQRQRNVVFGIAFYSLNVFFVLQILGAGQGYLADRFTYVPYFGLFFLVAMGYESFIEKQPGYKMIIQVLLSLYILGLGYMTWRQTETWKNSETMWTKSMKNKKDASLLFSNRAMYYFEEKKYDKALADYFEAIRINPKAEYFFPVGVIYYNQGNDTAAIKALTSGIEKEPGMADLWIYRGEAYRRLKNYPLALTDLTKGMELDTSRIGLYIDRSFVYEGLGQIELAVRDREYYLSKNPGDDQLWFECGRGKRILGKEREAISDFDKAISIKPEGMYYLQRSYAYYRTGDMKMAKQDAQAAISKGSKMDPAYLKVIGL